MSNEKPGMINPRREFLKKSSALAIGGTLASHLAFPNIGLAKDFKGSEETIKVGLIGCGGRGTGAASNALRADDNVQLIAMADVYENRLNNSLNSLKNFGAQKVDVTPERKFVGLDAYQRLIDSGVDLVILATPPGFRPLHLEAAVKANKHIFCEKPMAVDIVGARKAIAAAQEAKQKGLALMAGFCWRYHFAIEEVYDRIHNGGIGEPMNHYATYYTGNLNSKFPGTRHPGQSDVDWQIANWYNFVWLSGDHLVEQAVHSVDKICWTYGDKHPVSAVATGGPFRREYGDIYDHFHIAYEFENGKQAHLGCRQMDGCHGENADYINGTNGNHVYIRFDRPEIRGKDRWRYRGPGCDMYQNEHDILFASLRAGEPKWDGDRMMNSTITAIMGRMAAFTGKKLSWDDIMNSKLDTYPENLTWDMKLPEPKYSVPGVTPFV